MDKEVARQKASDHLTKLVADCHDALGASDVWYDYSPSERSKSLALFRETSDLAGRLLASLEDGGPVARADWRRVMPHETQWNDIYKALFAGPPD